MKNYIRTYSGTKFTFLDPKANQVRVNDILIHSAKTCRYHGMIDGWYSNAEHLILCAERAPNSEIARQCLIHDFGEMVTNDVAGPVKAHCPDYDSFCGRIQHFMNFHFVGQYFLDPMVKAIDMRMCATEMKVLRKNADEDLAALPYENAEFPRWDWPTAYFHIQQVFQKLFPDYKDAV